jgi:hypothetical protein
VIGPLLGGVIAGEPVAVMPVAFGAGVTIGTGVRPAAGAFFAQPVARMTTAPIIRAAKDRHIVRMVAASPT